jgi:hypothetical protein
MRNQFEIQSEGKRRKHMKTTSLGIQNNSDLKRPSLISKVRWIGLNLTIAATVLCGLGSSTLAQNPVTARIADEQGFTIPPGVQTPVVLKTQPDAACDLHEGGVADPAKMLRVYANEEGYVKVHVGSKQGSGLDSRVQLDCAAAGRVVTYPLHLGFSSFPTDDMPAPQSAIPAPKGSRVLPALTDEAARQLSDAELMQLGYSPRPDAAASPDNYAKWLESFSRPVTLLPPHSLSHPDVAHRGNVQAGPESSSNWSGFEAHSGSRAYIAVYAQWYVPEVLGESGNVTYSATWVGLDGDGVSDLVQAGTEQNCVVINGVSYDFLGAWTELVPNQMLEQGVSSLSPNIADEMSVKVWVGDSKGNLDQHGGYAWFFLYDVTQGNAVEVSTSFNGTYFSGSEAEWIMERPFVNGSPADLADYMLDGFSDSYVLPTSATAWTPLGTAQNRQITMYNEGVNNHPDNNELSHATALSPTGILFGWVNFH